MFQEMMINSGSGGGSNLELIPASSYGDKSVTFSWNFNAVGYFVAFEWTDNSYQLFSFGELGTDNIILGAPQDGVSFPSAVYKTWSSISITATSTARSLTLSHVSKNFKNAYIVPLYGTVSSS